jgi:hypothetical protein
MVTQVAIARHVGLDVSSVNKILHRTPGPVFGNGTIDRVFKAARRLGFDFEALKHRHRRRDARKETALEAEISIYRMDGSLFDKGEAKVRDLSVGGALLADLRLPQGALPVESFSIWLRLQTRKAEAIEVCGRLLRVERMNGGLAFGVKFHEDAVVGQALRPLLGSVRSNS